MKERDYLVSTGLFFFPKVLCPDVDPDYCTSLIHLSSQYACETRKSCYLRFTNRKLKHRGRKQTGRSPADVTAETSSASSAAWRSMTRSCLGFLLLLVPAQRHCEMWFPVSHVNHAGGLVCWSSVICWWREDFKNKGVAEEPNDGSHGFGPLLQWSSENDADFRRLATRQFSVSGGWSKAIFEEPRVKPGCDSLCSQ